MKFSILLPTRNRSEILAGAIESALAQSYEDFELIISDNDESEEKTRDVVTPFLKDKRVRYFRTAGNLSIYDNWENALLQSSGDFVLVLEDKVRFVRDALEILNEEPGDVTSFGLSFCKEGDFKGVEKGSVSVRSSDLLRGFASFDPLFFRVAPKGIDSSVRRSKLLFLREKYGRCFSPVTQDYSLAFMLLKETESIRHVQTTLAYIPNNWMWQGKYSIGMQMYTGGKWASDFYEKSGLSEKIIRDSLIKSLRLWINPVLTDARRLGVHFDEDEYLSYCVVIILKGIKLKCFLFKELIEVFKAGAKRGTLDKVILSSARKVINECLNLGS